MPYYEKGSAVWTPHLADDWEFRKCLFSQSWFSPARAGAANCSSYEVRQRRCKWWLWWQWHKRFHAQLTEWTCESTNRWISESQNQQSAMLHPFFGAQQILSFVDLGPLIIWSQKLLILEIFRFSLHIDQQTIVNGGSHKRSELGTFICTIFSMNNGALATELLEKKVSQPSTVIDHVPSFSYQFPSFSDGYPNGLPTVSHDFPIISH